jgi:uncharacterized repeat protein (TIGR01451 family)
MKRTSRRIGLTLLLSGAVLATAGWAWGQVLPPPVPSPAEPGKPVQLPQQATPTPAPQSGPVQTLPVLPPARGPASIKDIAIEVSDLPNQGNPTGRQEPGVGLEWVCPSTARLGQPVICTIIVKSLSTNRLHNVTIHSRMPAAGKVVGTEPKAEQDGDLMAWNLGTLEPRQEKRIDVQVVPTAKGSLACHAFVTFTGSSTARVEVREPKLSMTITGPKKAVIGDAVPVTLLISNPGDAPAERVKVKAVLSDGLEYARGPVAEFNLDNLGPGESRTVVLMCNGKSVGGQSCTALATADPELACNDTVSFDVIAPALDVVVSGPALRYLDRPATLSFRVTNPGSATANHVTLTEIVPTGFKVMNASHGGRHDFVTRSVVWYMGDLEPGASKDVTLELMAINPGEFKHVATVTAARGLKAQGETSTRVEGLSALLMELVDTEDPVEVGKQTSYEIRVTNTGSKTETNLQLTCTIPEQMEFKGAKGPAGCPFRIEGREVIFNALPKLAPRVDAIYRVNVRCLAPGDARFQARVRADGLTQPVLREESTRVYGDEK